MIGRFLRSSIVVQMSTSSSSPLAGLTMLVTGASSGIGRAIAIAAARAGADVAITYRSNDAGAREVEGEIVGIGRRAAVFQFDLGREDDIARLGPSVRDTFGRIDAWVNNAGADIVTGTAASLPRLERLDIVTRVDLRGTVLASWHAAELMRAQPDGGVIINVSWDHVLVGMSGTTQEIFSAVKGGVLSFSKSLARSVAPKVRVNILAPGWIETSFGASADQRWYREVAESTPLKRWGTPDDVAGAAVFLASPAASFLTGQTLLVGGGLVM
jgi:3-oxoacyl-[acyl-carrier protein] reductase